MTTTTESWLPATDGLKLLVKRFTPEALVPKAKLIFLHGHDHHCRYCGHQHTLEYGIGWYALVAGMYEAFFRILATTQIEVVAYDLRGFGHSINRNTPAGDSGPTSTTLNDLSTIITAETTTNTNSNPPLFLMGHSMGGAIVFTCSCLSPANLINKIRGWLGEAPDFGLPPNAPTRPSPVKLAILRLLHFFAPRGR
ncbi:Alpha/Beta hydrolase protein [Aspergillus californicus]